MQKKNTERISSLAGEAIELSMINVTDTKKTKPNILSRRLRAVHVVFTALAHCHIASYEAAWLILNPRLILNSPRIKYRKKEEFRASRYLLSREYRREVS